MPLAMRCGDRLGDMTNELRSDEYTEEFASGGPKNCAYRTVNVRTPERKTKVRGVTLNYTAC